MCVFQQQITTASFYPKSQSDFRRNILFWKALCCNLHATRIFAERVFWFSLWLRECLNFNCGERHSDGMLFATWNKGALGASERSPQNRLTALWAVGRFLPRWASSPAWQRRLDVIKLHTLSAVWGSVKWALLLPTARPVIVYLHRSCEVSKRGLRHMRPQLHIHLVGLFTCSVFGFPDVFFFFPPFSLHLPLCFSWRLVWKSHL